MITENTTERSNKLEQLENKVIKLVTVGNETRNNKINNTNINS